MPSAAVNRVCDLVADVAVTNAATLQRHFASLVAPYSVAVDSEQVLKTFAFMNWTIAQGVWAHLKDSRLCRDLLLTSQRHLVTKLAHGLCASSNKDVVAAKAGHLYRDLLKYIEEHTDDVRVYGYANVNGSRRFAIEKLRREHRFDHCPFNAIVANLWSDEEVNSEVESVAIQITKEPTLGDLGRQMLRNVLLILAMGAVVMMLIWLDCVE